MACSSKVLGKYEVKIMSVVRTFLEKQGYSVQTHRRLNIAWSNIISDLDIAASKDGKLTVVEVKSSHDNLKRVNEQYDNIKDYVDYYWVATDFEPKLSPTWRFDDRIGVMVVDVKSKKVKVIEKAQIIDDAPRVKKLAEMSRLCMIRLVGQPDGVRFKHTKWTIAEFLAQNNCTKEMVTNVVSCGRDCENGCPIWNFVVRHIPKLYNDKPDPNQQSLDPWA